MSARDLDTGKVQSITISGTSNLSEEEIQRAMRDAAMYAGQDKERRDAIEALNAAEAELYRVNTALGSPAGKALDRETRNRIKDAGKALERAVKRKKPESLTAAEAQAIRSAQQALESLAAPLVAQWEASQR